MKLLLKMCIPLGTLLLGAYFVATIVMELPLFLKPIVEVGSLLLIAAGLVYVVLCMIKRKNPYAK